VNLKKKTNNTSLYEHILRGGELFRHQPTFFFDLAEKFCQELTILKKRVTFVVYLMYIPAWSDTFVDRIFVLSVSL
jgi:hypothetical protein